MNILGIYYLLVFLLVGIAGSITAMDNFDVMSGNKLKLIFMYQYMVYELAKGNLNIAGIIILEIFTTFSVWFLNVIIFVVICLYYVLLAICKVFYFIFKKR